MTTLSFGNMLFILIIVMVVYTTIDRICRCIENCAVAKSFSESVKNGYVTPNDKAKKMEEMKDGLK